MTILREWMERFLRIAGVNGEFSGKIASLKIASDVKLGVTKHIE